MKKKQEIDKILTPLLKEKISFAMELRAYRTRFDLTQEELAKNLGVSKQYVNDLEHKRRFVSVQKACEYAEKLGESKKFYVMLALQDMVDDCGLKYKVSVA